MGALAGRRSHGAADSDGRGWLVAARLFWTLVLVALSLSVAAPASANDKYAAIVIDAVTGEVLHESRADKQLHPASLTKLMTLYLTFKAIDEGRLSLNQQIPISRHAAGQAPSKLGLPAGSTIRVEDAIYALVTKSANDIATALGEAIGGTETQFARMMTDQARALGMTNTVFRNAHGLPNNEQVSTARDMATLARAVMRDFPERYHYFGTKSWTYRGTTYRTHNRLMERYAGMDGMKTGYIRASGFNLVASAKRGNLRLITVVFGGRTAASRDARVAELMDEAFRSSRGQYLIAHGESTFLPFKPPLPTPRPGITGPITVAEDARSPFAQSAAQLASELVAAANPIPSAMAKVPVPPTPPAPVQSPYEDLSLVALSAANGFPEGTVGGDIPGDGSDWSIQVGAFSDPDAGGRALSMARSTVPDILKDAGEMLLEIHTNSGRLFRARLTGLTEDTAASACAALTKAGSPCLPIAPDSRS